MSAPWVRSGAYHATAYKRTWRGTAFTSFLAPVLFLGAIGKGLGSLVDANDTLGAATGVAYLSFLAPGLLASATLTATAQEATYPVHGGVKWNRSYVAMVNTPLRPADALRGHVAFWAARALMVAAIFVFVMLCFGAIESAWVLAAIPAAALGGLAVAIPLSAYSVTLEREGGFAAVNRFVLTPMMLFAGAFFPVSQLPIGFRVFAYLTPMWHSVDLCRTLALGEATVLRSLGHVAVLCAFAAVGYAISRRCYVRVLTP